MYANQWRIGLNAGKTTKLLFQRSSLYLPDWHITLHGRAIRFCHLCHVSWHHFRHHVILHQTFPCYHQACSSPPSQTPIYLKRTNFRVYKFSRISRILAKFAKLNTREISCWVKFAKINTREKEFKNSKFRVIFLLLILSDIKETT